MKSNVKTTIPKPLKLVTFLKQPELKNFNYLFTVETA
jgi:hypothetical protein